MRNGRVNILHIRDSSGIYGAERHILTLGKHIDKSRFDISLLCMRREDGRSDRLISKASEIGISVIPVDVRGRLDIFALKEIRSVLLKKKVSVIHSHDFKSNFYSVLASAKLGIRKVATAHGSTRDSLLQLAYLCLDERIVYRSIDSIIAVSENLRIQLKNRLPNGKVSVIQNGIDPDLLNAEDTLTSTPLLIPEGHRVFAVIGRLFPDKGHRFFLRAFSELRRHYPHVTGLIVGDGPERDAIAGQIQESGLDQAVLMCGVRSDMKDVYSRIDFLVMPSLTEGLPYVLLEAMANRIPVLASSVGDIPLLISDETTGYLVPPGDEWALTKRMTDLMVNPDKAQGMAAEAFKVLHERFTAEKMVRETEDLYMRLLSK